MNKQVFSIRLIILELTNIYQDIANHPARRKQSQSSYIEMNPEEMFVGEDDPYMRVENFTENDYLHMERKKMSEEPLFQLENHQTDPANYLHDIF